MKIAVVGGGFAGLATAWYLSQFYEDGEIVLFDFREISAGTSGVATGLLHPFPGKFARKSWRAEEAMEASKELLEVSQKALGRAVSLHSGILRLAMTAEQELAFREPRQGAFFLSPSEISFFMEPVKDLCGLWIPSGITVFSRSYLEGLWFACAKRGVKKERKKIETLNELDHFDLRIFATGFETLRWKEFSHLPLRWKIGQVLVCRWPSHLSPVSSALIGGAHLSRLEDDCLCQLGSTYENSLHPNPERVSLLQEKVAQFFPPARDFETVEVRSGVRISPKEGHRPIIEKINSNTWVFTGLGSRGLLYHALLAKELVALLSSCERVC